MIVNNCKLTQPVCISKDSSIVEVANVLKEQKTRNIVICEDDKPIGIVSSVDIVNHVVADGKDPRKLKASDIMTTPAFSCEASDDVRRVYFEMVKRNLFVCPVTKDGKLIGSLSMHEAVNRIKAASLEGKVHNG